MHDARLSRSLAQVAAVRRIFTRGKDRQRPEQSRALVTKWIDQYRVADPAPDAAGNGPVLRPPDDARGWWTIDARETGAPARTLFYLHGGGFVHYSARTFVPLLASGRARTGRGCSSSSIRRRPSTLSMRSSATCAMRWRVRGT